jgi:hypothetical protein
VLCAGVREGKGVCASHGQRLNHHKIQFFVNSFVFGAGKLALT